MWMYALLPKPPSPNWWSWSSPIRCPIQTTPPAVFLCPRAQVWPPLRGPCLPIAMCINSLLGACRMRCNLYAVGHRVLLIAPHHKGICAAARFRLIAGLPYCVQRPLGPGGETVGGGHWRGAHLATTRATGRRGRAQCRVYFACFCVFWGG